MMAGKFITIEGIDGCGKSTQAKRMANWVRTRGVPVLLTREPGGTGLGEQLRELVLSVQMSPETEVLTLLAARSHHCSEVIAPALNEGRWVICERFTDSTIAYQGFGGKLDLCWLVQWCMATCSIEPDLTFWLSVDPQAAQARIHKRNPDRIEARGRSFWADVDRGFALLAATNRRRIRMIDGNLPEDLVAEAIAQQLPI